MNIITPKSTPTHTLRAGDVVVFDGDNALFMVSSESGQLYAVRFDGSDFGVMKKSDEWIDYWTNRYKRSFTIYSSDEWALQLVRRDSESSTCACGESNIVHNGVCLDCAMAGKREVSHES